MSIKERTYQQILDDETQYIALNRVVDTANDIVSQEDGIENIIYENDSLIDKKDLPQAGEGFSKQKRYRAECMQRLIKEMYKDYGSKCNKFPEIRFQIFPNNRTVVNIFDGKKKDYYSF